MSKAQASITFQGVQVEVLQTIVSDWISEGHVTPPYEDAYYDIFEALGLSSAADDPYFSYDTLRPQ